MSSTSQAQGMRRVFTRAGLGLLLAVGLLAFGCDDDVANTDTFDHTPPAGQGALIVNNQTDTEIDAYLDGLALGRVDNVDFTIFDHVPGNFRVVLTEVDGDRTAAVTVDVLEGRQTILDVNLDFGSLTAYDVTVRYD